VVDALLGLISSFLLAMVTDRALLVEWTHGWATPLDQLSVLGSQVLYTWRYILGELSFAVVGIEVVVIGEARTAVAVVIAP